MPLLRKQPFHKQKPPPDLHPEEEVFHCKITNEIFRNYEAFFERIILCNSLVWSCAITGRGGMTYQEAVDCEERAKRHLATFQENLQRPLLFLASLTHRSRLADLNDDVFLFAKDRYFIGETVDVSVGGERKVARVVNVTATAVTKVGTPANGDVIVIDEDSESDDAAKRSLLDPDCLMYVVQPLGSKAAPLTIKASQVSRKRGLYTRDKSKLFLKQHCEPVMGVWTVKEDKLNKLGLKNAKFEDFCGGPKPMFAVSVIKRKSKKPAADMDVASFSLTPDRTSQSQHSYAKSHEPGMTVKHEQPLLTPEERQAQREQQKQEKLAEKMARREEMKRKLEEEKQRRKEEREKEREKKREERRLQIEHLKEWSRPREDMECDDLKPLPDFTEARTRVPSPVFGDAVMVLEFVNAFKGVFDFKQFFPKGFTWANLETALMESDPEGPLCDLLQMLLCAIFNLQEEEAEEYQELEREECHKDSSAQNTGEDEQVEEDISISNNELIRSATVAAQFSQQTFGMPLRDTLLDQFTLTEVLRLHLLSSGARASSKNARFRYQQRGGYSSLDDPGLELRKQESGLLKKLQACNVFDLSPGEKVRLLSALVQQVATYAAIRDIMEESFDKLRLRRYDLKQMQWAEQRREREEAAARYRRLMEVRLKEREKRLHKLPKPGEHQSMGTLPDLDKNAELTSSSPHGIEAESVVSSDEREKLEAKEHEEEGGKRAAFIRKELEMLQQIFELQRCNAVCPLGRDRFYRRYWLIGSLPAVLVEDNELFTGNLTASVEEQGSPMPQLTRHDEGNTSSDKENDLSAVVARGPDKATSVCVVKEDCIVISDEEGESKSNAANIDEPPQLDISQCLNRHAGVWYVLDSQSSFDQLMASLNPRGFRESSLHAALQDMRPLINLTIESCPLDCFRTGARETAEPLVGQSAGRWTGHKLQEQTASSSASEAMEMTLRDLLLDLDDRIFAGSLGTLKQVEDRTVWRETLQQGHYDPQTDDPTFAPQDTLEPDNSMAMESAARDLGRALVQIARGIEPRFLCAPLEDGGEGNRSRAYERWEESSLAVTSLSQVFLHLATLDRSVKWDRSALLARCRICRRKGDADKMLLCDGCDRGHHMYCLKPPMMKIPPGDWFCWDCRPKEPRHSPRKNRRRTFSEMSDEESDDEVLSLEDSVEDASNEEEAEDRVCNFEEDDEEEEDEENEDVCAVCHNDGKLILCDVCPRSYHLHCANPKLKKVPRGKWMCQVCVGGNRAGKIHFPKPQRPTKTNCKTGKKTTNSKLGKSSHSGSRTASPAGSPCDSPAPTHSTRAKKRESSEKEVSPRVKSREVKSTPKQKSAAEKDIATRSRTHEKEAIKHKRSSAGAVHMSQSSDFETNMKQYTSSKRGNSQVQQMRACEELVQELMRHEDAWPFLKPVDKRLVPDYYDVITSPMDLSTIRNRVHSFRYNAPAELVADIRLIFSNCVEYNARTTPEYRAGQTLAKFFQTRVRELGIHTETEATSPAVKKLRR